MNLSQVLPESQKLEAGNNKEYKVKAIIDSVVYGQQANNLMLDFYYLILWKGYPGKKNTWKPALVVMHLEKLISIFYKEHPKKPIAISPLLDSTLLMARLSVPKEPK